MISPEMPVTDPPPGELILQTTAGSVSPHNPLNIGRGEPGAQFCLVAHPLR